METIILPISRRELLLSLASATLLPSRTLSASVLNTLKPLALPSPNTLIEDKAGQLHRLADYAPMPLLINFWASWCPPCIRELPALASLDKILRGEGKAVLLIGVDRKGREFGENFLKQHNINIALTAYDPQGALLRALQVNIMPSSFLLSRDSILKAKIEGERNWQSPQIASQIATLLN